MFEKLRSTPAPDEQPTNGDGQEWAPAEVAPVAAEVTQPAVHEAPPSDRHVGRLRPSLASLLADEGVASKEQLEHAAAEGLESGERLGEVVLRRGWITEAGLANLIARQWDLTFVARSLISVDADAQARMSRDVGHQLGVCPVTSAEGAPLVAVADPSDERFAAAQEALGGPCTFVVTTPSALAQLIDELPASAHVVSLAASPAPVEPLVLSVAEVEPEPAVELQAEPEAEPEAEYEVEPERVAPEPAASEPVAPSTPAPAPLAAADPDDDSPVLDQLDKLLDRLVSERTSTGDELAGYRTQLDELAAEQARLEESVRSLEAKLGQEDELLDSIRTKLAGLS